MTMSRSVITKGAPTVAIGSYSMIVTCRLNEEWKVRLRQSAHDCHRLRINQRLALGKNSNILNPWFPM